MEGRGRPAVAFVLSLIPGIWSIVFALIAGPLGGRLSWIGGHGMRGDFLGRQALDLAQIGLGNSDPHWCGVSFQQA